MSEHQELLALLVARDELTPEQCSRLERHLAGCTACRIAGGLYAENRRRLHGLQPVSPPRDLRQRLLDSVDRTAEVIGLWAPFVFAFCLLPVSFVAAVVVLIYGLVAWLALFAAIGLFAYLTARRYPHLDSTPMPSEPTGQKVRRLVRALSLDAAAIVAAAAGLSLVFALLAIVQQGRLSGG
jgi:hypothetical protein